MRPGSPRLSGLVLDGTELTAQTHPSFRPPSSPRRVIGRNECADGDQQAKNACSNVDVNTNDASCIEIRIRLIGI